MRLYRGLLQFRHPSAGPTAQQQPVPSIVPGHYVPPNLPVRVKQSMPATSQENPLTVLGAVNRESGEIEHLDVYYHGQIRGSRKTVGQANKLILSKLKQWKDEAQTGIEPISQDLQSRA